MINFLELATNTDWQLAFSKADQQGDIEGLHSPAEGIEAPFTFPGSYGTHVLFRINGNDTSCNDLEVIEKMREVALTLIAEHNSKQDLEA